MEFEVLDINKNKKEIRKNIAKVAIGLVALGLGVVGMRYFGEAFVNKLHSDEPFSSLVAFAGYGSLTAASLLVSTGGGVIMSENIPKMKESIRKNKELKRELKKRN